MADNTECTDSCASCCSVVLNFRLSTSLTGLKEDCVHSCIAVKVTCNWKIGDSWHTFGQMSGISTWTQPLPRIVVPHHAEASIGTLHSGMGYLGTTPKSRNTENGIELVYSKHGPEGKHLHSMWHLGSERGLAMENGTG